MMNDYEAGSKLTLELCCGINSPSSLAETVVDPVWERVERGVAESFRLGGFVRLEVLSPKTSFVRLLSMKSFPGKFRLDVLTSSLNPKEEFLEWWELESSPYRGSVKFGEDECDARTVCADVLVAEAMFKELYETGDLKVGLTQMRSPWNPIP